MGLRKAKSIKHNGKKLTDILEAHTRFFSGKEGGARADLAGAGSDVASGLLHVCGFPSGGTDLMRNVLNSHPDIEITGELQLLPRLADRFGAEIPVARADALADALRRCDVHGWLRNPRPDLAARAAIIGILVEGKPTRDVDVERVALRTDGFSGADLKGVLDRAVLAKLEGGLFPDWSAEMYVDVREYCI